MRFKFKFKDIYKSKGEITLKAFADIIEFPISSLQSTLSGAIPTEKTLKKIIVNLNINPEFFYVENVVMYLDKPKELTKKNFTQKLNDIKKEINMNYSSLAHNLNYSSIKIGFYFRNVCSPSYEFMRRLIVFYNINPNYFFFDDEKIIKDDMYLYPKRFLDDEGWFARKWYEEIQLLIYGNYKITPEEIKKTSDEKIITITNYLKEDLDKELGEII